MTTKPNLKMKPLAAKVTRAVRGDMQTDISEDESLMEEESYNWDELNELRDDLGKGIMSFVFQVKSVIEQPDVINNLGDMADEFSQVTSLFFNDINDFSMRVKENRMLHDGKSGKVTDLTDFNTYNRCAMMYHSLFSELSALVTPTLSKLMLIISEIVDTSKSNAASEESQQLVNETNTGDTLVKEEHND